MALYTRCLCKGVNESHTNYVPLCRQSCVDTGPQYLVNMVVPVSRQISPTFIPQGGYSIHRAKRRAYALVALLHRGRFLLQLQLHKRIKFVLLVTLVQRHVSAKSEFYMTFSATRKSEARNGSTWRTDTQTDIRTDGHVQGLMRPAGGCIITCC